MYGKYPGGAGSVDTPPQATPPQSVLRAAKIMYVGAAASLIGIVVNLTTLSSARTAISKANTSLTPDQVTTAVHVLVGETIASGLIGAALWIWMSQSSRAGKGWARVLSTIFFGLETVGLLVAIASSGSSTVGAGPARFYVIVVWLIGLTATILLWQRSSSDYFRAPRY
jgi:hypothetical protein